MANIERLMATIQPPMAKIPSPYGENYFAMADMVCVVEEGMAEVIFDRTM